ncbi:AAA family ATPase [Phenylobacterium sp.]|uniref:AAA family ATPase n=1 Tax=Phenylobacterium sp. TaxID=1871053 RepID=UPI002B689375|nr:AAA family ATPase [Phenylobacterium sp.]HLZ77140.1 AAA family ATPase [Phenylobacterium sp.]
MRSQQGGNLIVVALAGLPGAGKTTLARTLQARAGFWFVSRDDIRAAMFQPCDFTSWEKDAAFEATLQAVAANLRGGRRSVVDGVAFSHQRDRDQLRTITEANGATFHLVHLKVPISIAQERVEADRSTSLIGDRNAALVEEVAARFEPFTPDTIEVDAVQSPAFVAGAVFAHLNL